MAESGTEAARATGRAPLARVAAFTLGFAIAALGALAVIRADLVHERIERLRFGTTSRGGMLLTIAPVSSRALAVRYTNISSAPILFIAADGGDELAIELRTLDGRAVDPPSAPPPIDVPIAPRFEPVVVAPGSSVELSLPFARFVPAPGVYRVALERTPLEPDRLRLRSNEVEIDAR